MKTSIFLTIASISILLLSNCVESTAELATEAAKVIVQSHAQVKGSGKIVEKEIEVADFSSIENATSFDIEIKQGDKATVKVVTDDNLQDFLYFKQVEGKLTISIQVKASFEATKSIIYVTVKDLNSLISSGTGDVKISKLSSENFTIENNGTGDINYLDMSSKILNISNSGTGDIKLEGTIENLNIENSGTGDITALNLEANYVELSNSGTGDVSIKAKTDLKIENTGTGDVKYYGKPEKSTINSSGTGDVIKKD
ncbi:MAG: hypothetical protein A2033_09690 [Bacteroidetes bacterium GWA2_31_9]|nr:MAG: hypothetical protein A2033_09690 [Bacteroidetes bacterium GWA2_31_9]